MKKSVALLLFGLAMIFVFAVIALWPQEYQRVASSDGRHIAVAKYRAYEGWLPIFPGASGDKRGWAEVFTREGKKIGKLDLGMVSQLRDLRWDANSVALPGSGEIRR